MNRGKRLIALVMLLLLVGCGKTTYSGQGARPGYTRHEPGHWEQTNVLTIGPNEETRRDGELTVSAQWDEKHHMVYTFTGPQGQAKCTVEPYWFSDTYYISTPVQPGVNVVREADRDDTAGDVICSLAIADIAQGQGKYGVQVTVRDYFKTKRDGTPIERFSIGENMTQSTGYNGQKYYIDPNGYLPEGQAEGEKIYIVLGVMDDGEGTTRMYTAWEYTWRAQPETIEVPPAYGPIEEFASSAPLLYYLLPALGLVLLAVILVLVRKGRRRRK